MRIGIDASNLRQGGGRTHLIELLTAADPKRDRIDSVVVWGSQETLDLLPRRRWLQKIAVACLEKGFLARMGWQTFALKGEATKARCDLLIVPGGIFQTRFRPIVVMCRNMLPFDLTETKRYGVSFKKLRLAILRYFQGRSFKSADGVIFLTRYAREKIFSSVGQLQGASRIIPHGVNHRFLINNPKPPQKRTTTEKKLKLIYVSIIDQYKHQWKVVEAVAAARIETDFDLELHLAGPAYEPSLRKLEAAIARHDPGTRWVHYHGNVAYEDLPRLYAQAQIGIFASTCENMPNILLETMAAGLPILCSDRGPMPEVLGKAGVYFDPENPDSMCRQLIALLKAQRTRRRLGLLARQEAQKYSWDKCAKETFRFCHQILGRHQNRHSH